MFFTIVDQGEVAIIQRFGKFTRVGHPGFNPVVPFVESVAGKLSLRIRQLDVGAETKTLDNVFVTLRVSVQYNVDPNRVYDAYYRLSEPEKQITAYVFDVVRARVPKLNLDEVFDLKDDIADAVKTELGETMEDFGFNIVKALVTDIEPDPKVREAMNEINAARRMRQAAVEKAEADRITKVKAAEADAEAKRLQGVGIAAQREAIVAGFRRSIESAREALGEGVGASEATTYVLMTQYFDTLKELGSHGTKTVFMPSSPGSVNHFMQEMAMGMETNNHS